MTNFIAKLLTQTAARAAVATALIVIPAASAGVPLSPPREEMAPAFAFPERPAPQRTNNDARLEDILKLYEDPDNLFQLVIPKHWRTRRTVDTNNDGSVTVRFLASDPDAELAEIRGWVSAGLRVTVTLPPSGREWTTQGQVQWAKTVAENLVDAYDKVKAGDAEQGQRSGRASVEWVARGSARKISEPELAFTSLIPAKDALISIEIATPESQEELFKAVYKLFDNTFKVAP